MRNNFFSCKVVMMSCFIITTTCQSQLRKIYLQPKTVATEKQTKFVDSLRFIPLEIVQGIDLGSNYNITVTAKYILLTDYMNKDLLAYSKDGKFVKKVSYKKLGESF